MLLKDRAPGWELSENYDDLAEKVDQGGALHKLHYTVEEDKTWVVYKDADKDIILDISLDEREGKIVFNDFFDGLGFPIEEWPFGIWVGMSNIFTLDRSGIEILKTDNQDSAEQWMRDNGKEWQIAYSAKDDCFYLGVIKSDQCFFQTLSLLDREGELVLTDSRGAEIGYYSIADLTGK
jgi:hypothetical protein